MIKKVKNWLGIEGVKVDLELPEAVKGEDGLLMGRVLFFTKTDQQVTGLRVKLVERYARGRGDSKKIDEYVLGQIELDQSVDIPAEQTIGLDFRLHFDLLKSEMDEFAGRNFLLRGLVRTAKWASRVRSKYFVIAEASVKGVALDPFSKKEILIQ